MEYSILDEFLEGVKDIYQSFVNYFNGLNLQPAYVGIPSSSQFWDSNRKSLQELINEPLFMKGGDDRRNNSRKHRCSNKIHIHTPEGDTSIKKTDYEEEKKPGESLLKYIMRKAGVSKKSASDALKQYSRRESSKK